MTDLFNPLLSLKEGHWFKLICGASFQHLPAVRSLALAYTLAGADCIDVAADPAVVAAAREGLKAAASLGVAARRRGFSYQGTPLLMVSLNDGEDPHFRKAEFDSTKCPSQCSRPCESICPAQAITFNSIKYDFNGVLSDKCYGCGRCLPVCPYDRIAAVSYATSVGAIAPLILKSGVDAVEIHTTVGRLVEFKKLWQTILPYIGHLKLVAISCPHGEGMIDYLHELYDAIAPLNCVNIWQIDGRSMSGDIGSGTTLAAVKLGAKVLRAKLPGYVQLAGGTNSYTVPKLRAMGLLKELTRQKSEVMGENNVISHTSGLGTETSVAGVAYGSYARKLLSSVLEELEEKEVNSSSVKVTARLEEDPTLLWQAVSLADSLVSQLKS
ncbi:circadian clock protein LdpA [Rivularia sp. UHCC 0363]|uniref:circadian clock protein LdpA n=1 Tax=Rivularia sp. UHCC 0363 TaxID=3110244 RepID=UPI002B21F7CB|nr:LdpA C-terminal domain-containing domain [Rivularia sp. UHCC 0363]MEA5595201.1 LdpA C-terminal domain-containing domain [Rivularia sp. UHCC 0363]